MIRLNLFLCFIAISILVLTLWERQKTFAKELYSIFETKNIAFDFETLDKETKNKINSDYTINNLLNINKLNGISYNDYAKIIFRPEYSIWKNFGLPFQVQFFHPGHIYNKTVEIYEIDDEDIKAFKYDKKNFNFGNLKLSKEFTKDEKTLKYTGFKVLYPINSNSLEEFVVFQGASYFRVISKGQVYGLSCRGIAINSGISNEEEFPEFDKFYIKKPNEFDNSLTIYATLSGESIVGTYRFIFFPGITTQVQVKARIYLKKVVKRLGLVPLTSMFLYGETDDPIGNNIYPEIHDSDGLLIEDNSGDWIWNPLTNPTKSKVIEIDTNNFKGFGLIQRDRKFKNYQDSRMKYHMRPSSWIKPSKSWGKGKLYLMQNSTLLDSDDNIVTFFEPMVHPKLKEPFDFEYTLFFPNLSPPNHRLAKVSSVFKGEDPLYPNYQTITIYFTGKNFEGNQEQIQKRIIPIVQTNKTSLKFNSTIEKIEELNQVRLTLRYKKINTNIDGPIEWKVHLNEGQEKKSETWIYYDGI